jgi:DNA-binding HxlR family transcriptional regulator
MTNSTTTVDEFPAGDRTEGCSIQRTLDLVGDRWILLIMRDIFRGVRRFAQVQEDLGIARNLLADRLTRLVEAGILEKIPYQQRPVRYEYHLTTKGQDLSASLVALMHWGDTWCNEGEAPTVLVHRDCGSPLEQVLHCPECNNPVDPTSIGSRPGPGRQPTGTDPDPAAANRAHDNRKAS